MAAVILEIEMLGKTILVAAAICAAYLMAADVEAADTRELSAQIKAACKLPENAAAEPCVKRAAAKAKAAARRAAKLEAELAQLAQLAK